MAAIGREIVELLPEVRVLYMSVHRECDRSRGLIDAGINPSAKKPSAFPL